MLRKIFKTGNSIVVSLPQEFLEALNVELGSELELELDRTGKQVILKAPRQSLEDAGITQEFANQLDDFIEKYRPTLDKLSKS